MSEARMARLVPDRYTALLQIAQIVAAHHTLEELFHDLAPLLHASIQFQYLTLMLHDEKRNVMRMHTLEGTGLLNRRAIVSMMLLCYIRWRLEAACRKDPR